MKKNSLLLTLFCAVIYTAIAQKKTGKLPGDTSLPTTNEELKKLASFDKEQYKYNVEDYFKKPKQSAFQFSPDGIYLSYREKDKNGKNHVYIKNTTTNKVTKALEEKEELIRGYFWANNQRLVYIKDKGGNENYQLFAVDLDGNNHIELTPFKGVKARILNPLKDQKDFMIVNINKDNPQIFEPYKINITNGKLEKLFKNKSTQNPIIGYSFDKDGNLRAYTQQENGVNNILYYKINDTFQKVIKTSWKHNFYIIAFDYTSKNKDLAYVKTNLESNTDEIVLYDFKLKKIVKKVYNNETFDVGGLSQSRKRGYEIDFFYHSAEKPVVVPVSEFYKNLHARLTKEFTHENFRIVNRTDNEDKFLIYVSSDKIYGIYYLYDTKKGTIKKLLNTMPNLNPEDMVEMRPIKFTSRDGLTIHGYLTVPKQVKQKKKVPLIVYPHGGPYGPRDRWRFSPTSQLFASRGYATLQINFRGSGGYGKKHREAGYKQVGRKMLDDLEDGVAYVKSLGFIKENKIAIYGISYGGLATLGGLIKTPDLYTCGVDYVGVSNLLTIFKLMPAYWEPYRKMIYEQWYDVENAAEKKIMEEVSPALNADKITKPVFVIQGANDPRVNINESDQIVTNLRKKGFDVPYMVKYNEGHGFHHEDNMIDAYKTMMGFFAKNLKN